MTLLYFHYSQINVERVEDLDSICEELLGTPLLLRVWAEHMQQNEYENTVSDSRWEGVYASSFLTKAFYGMCLILGSWVRNPLGAWFICVFMFYIYYN